MDLQTFVPQLPKPLYTFYVIPDLAWARIKAFLTEQERLTQQILFKRSRFKVKNLRQNQNILTDLRALNQIHKTRPAIPTCE